MLSKEKGSRKALSDAGVRVLVRVSEGAWLRVAESAILEHRRRGLRA
jgi:hypothetical protein